ncbi:MAG: helix-turn-helix transcriptional regulator [Myxococcales bacterium]|nr:helix-turn-helix transcriptional regulator [Myxococcales bacterium]
MSEGTQREARAEVVERFDDPAPPLGIAYEHRARRRWALRSSARPRLLFVLEPTVGELVGDVLGADGGVPLDVGGLVLLAAGDVARAAFTSPVSRLALFELHPALVERCVATYAGQIDPELLGRILSRSRHLPRTTWMNELAQRYVFERAVCRRRDNDATRFLETELLKELYFLAREQDDAHARTSFLAGRSPTVRRALAYLEAHLFDEVDQVALARRSGASSSSLRRAFQRELGLSPLAYVRARRLDEARVRLAHDATSVSEVAMAVGYRSLAAFSRAYRARFGAPPSASTRRG